MARSACTCRRTCRSSIWRQRNGMARSLDCMRSWAVRCSSSIACWRKSLHCDGRRHFLCLLAHSHAVDDWHGSASNLRLICGWLMQQAECLLSICLLNNENSNRKILILFSIFGVAVNQCLARTRFSNEARLVKSCSSCICLLV